MGKHEAAQMDSASGSASKKPLLLTYALPRSGMVDGKEVKMEVKVGDQVIYSKYAGTEVKLEDEEFIVVKQNDILAIIQ